MRFSIFHALGAPGDLKNYNQHMKDARAYAQSAEDNGFWSVWYTEHHFGHEGQELTPNPILMGTDIAARTSKIRIGQAAAIATFWHPLRLAEDLALLDQLSDGRVEVGLGRGLYGREALNLNELADPRDRNRIARSSRRPSKFCVKRGPKISSPTRDASTNSPSRA